MTGDSSDLRGSGRTSSFLASRSMLAFFTGAEGTARSREAEPPRLMVGAGVLRGESLGRGVGRVARGGVARGARAGLQPEGPRVTLGVRSGSAAVGAGSAGRSRVALGLRAGAQGAGAREVVGVGVLGRAGAGLH